MINKREIILVVALAFSLGVIFTDLTRPNASIAETTNIVYDTLDAKINKLASRVNGIQAQVNSLQKKSDAKDPRVDSLAKSVRDVASVQRTILNDMATKKQLNDLNEKISAVEAYSQGVNAKVNLLQGKQ